MTLADVVGQTRAIDALMGALKSGAVHHAYLFSGQEGVGKSAAAVGLAMALFCTERPNVGCGECSSCHRVIHHNHPDLTWVMPDEERVARKLAGRADFTGTPSRDLRVDQIRALQERLALRPLEAKRKVAIISSAHRMNEPAQNAFLKTLEEPPPATTMILLSSATERLLPTIKSRCVVVNFGPLPAKLIAERVQRERKVDAATAELIAHLSSGSLGRALAFDVDTLKDRANLLRRFEGAVGGDVRALLRLAEELGKSRELVESALRLFEVWTRDVTVQKAKAGPLLNGDLAELAQEVATRHSELSLLRRQKLISEALEHITTRNASPRLQVERMFVEMGRLS